MLYGALRAYPSVLRVLLVQITAAPFCQDRRNRLRALPRCTVDQAAEDRVMSADDQITASPPPSSPASAKRALISPGT